MKSLIKTIVPFALCAVFLIIGTIDLDAQSKRRKKRESNDEQTTRTVRTRSSNSKKVVTPFKEKLVYEIGIGNVGFFGFGASSQFAAGFKPSVGYKIFNRLTAGVYGKFDYFYINRQNIDDSSLLDLGLGLYSRFKVIDAIYLKAEYGIQSYSYELVNNFIIEERQNFQVPFIGAGYVQGFGKWKFGAELMFNMNSNARDYNNKFIEYWLKVDYNF